MSDTIDNVLNLLADAERAKADAAAALERLSPALRGAFSHLRPEDARKLARVVPYVPTDEPLPRIHPFECYGCATFVYALPAEGWRETLAALRARHAPIPLVKVTDGSVAFRPEGVGIFPGRAKIESVSDFVIEADKTDTYPHEVEIRWWSEVAPGVVVRIECTAKECHALRGRVRYTLDNPPRGNVRQHPEDRRWSVSWTWGPGSAVVRWWTSPGAPPRRTWTWARGVELDEAIPT